MSVLFQIEQYLSQTNTVSPIENDVTHSKQNFNTLTIHCVRTVSLHASQHFKR